MIYQHDGVFHFDVSQRCIRKSSQMIGQQIYDKLEKL